LRSSSRHDIAQAAVKNTNVGLPSLRVCESAASISLDQANGGGSGSGSGCALARLARGAGAISAAVGRVSTTDTLGAGATGRAAPAQ
jgi:hypothetical protein